MLKTKLLNSNPSFSKRRMIVFAVLFAVIGGFFLYRTFAAGPLVASLEAEQMSLPSGGSIITDTYASSGKAVRLRGSGVIQGIVSLPSSLSSYSLVAKATKCHGKWPSMRVELSGVQLISTTVSSSGWTTYSASSNAASGNRNVYISYTGGSACTTDLYLDVSRFYGVSVGTPAPTISLSATPTSVSAGSPSTLTWNSTNATSCSASGAWSGAQPTSGSVSTGALNTTSTYTLSCSGSGGSANASTTVTVTAATPPPPPPPPSSAFFYSASSFWNLPIPSTATIDPNSSAMVQSLLGSANSSAGTPIAVKSYSVAAYYADANTPRTTVSFTTNYNGGATKFLNVPIPANAVPANGTDAHMLIIDKSTNCEYDFWKAAKSSTGAWSAGVANALLKTETGTFIKPAIPTRGSSFALGGGLILPSEMAAGVINHALVFSMDAQYVKGGGPVLPSYTSDGQSTAAGTIPEGARVRLNPALDLNSLGLNSWQKIIAKAMQTYGMYLGDRGGGLTLYALDPKSDIFSNITYPWGDVTYAYMPPSLYGNMQVMTLGPQQSQSYSIVQPPAVCGSTLQ